MPEAAERIGQPIENFLYLAEENKILLSVEAHHWPIVWGDERSLPGEPPIEIKEPIKPPFDYYNNGYFNLLHYDIHHLRENGKLSLTAVYAKKDDREFIGDIQRGTTDFRGQQQECELELSDIFISHEELQRVESHKVGNWEPKKESIPTEAVIDRHAVQKARTHSAAK